MAALPFLEERLDDRVTEGAEAIVSVPGRTKLYSPTGTLTQNFAGSIQVMKFDVVHGIRNPEQFFKVQDAFFIVLLTPYEGLRYRYWADYIAKLSNTRATLLDGSSTELQLQRKHVFGGIEYLRDILKPVSSTVAVYRTRSAVTTLISSTVDYTTGIATISGHAGGDAYSWTGQFDIPVTFTDDEWSAQMVGSVNKGFMVSGSIKLEEIRPVAP